MRAATFAACLAIAASCTGACAASTGIYAPLDRPGPALSVSQAALQRSLSCTGNLTDPAFEPVLLVPGTASAPHEVFSWNYERAFTQAGRPWCTVTLPGHTLLDIQRNGEYLVYAIRTLYAAAGNRRIGILGWSQGGMVPRWALRFWPDTRAMVADLIGLDPSNHGTLDSQASCLLTSQCPPAFWQQASDAQFIAALNSGAETFAGIAYTTIYSRTDEVVVPNETARGSFALHTGRGMKVNIAVQQICPNDLSEHLAMGTYDPVGYALAIDALNRTGPANPADIPPSVCLEPYQPGVKPGSFAQDFARVAADAVAFTAKAPEVTAEPALDKYVFR